MKEIVLEANPIIEWDVARLKRKSKPVKSIDEGMDIIHTLIAVTETFYKEKSAGLAAPQIGIFKRVFISHSPIKEGESRSPFQINDEWQGFINPVVLETEGDGEIDYDGCLSFPGLVATTKRWKRIKISAMNHPEPVWLEPGEDKIREDGFVAIGPGESIYFQHEYDHLNGILFFERATDKEEKAALIEEVKEHQKQLFAA
jgi:peptide deformylase